MKVKMLNKIGFIMENIFFSIEINDDPTARHMQEVVNAKSHEYNNKQRLTTLHIPYTRP